MNEIINQHMLLTPAQRQKVLSTLTIQNLSIKLLNIFSKHIGSKKAISKDKLFFKVFNKKYEHNYIDEFRFIYVRRAMHNLRKKSKCFIGSRNVQGDWHYFVLKDMNDANYYIDNLNNNIKRMRIMQRKAKHSVDNNWSKLNWIADYNNKKLL